MKNLATNKQLLKWTLIFFGIFCIIVARRPDIIFNVQPWAEDGAVWLANSNNNGFWSSLLLPHSGYYQTIPRLTYGIALDFGIGNAALVANVIAISIRCFFVMFILSERLSFIDIKYRASAVIYFLLMPNIAEGYVNITNTQWYLSLYLMAVLIADEAESSAWKVHDMVLLIISLLSGPFVVFIAPCLLLKRIAQRGGIIPAIRRINSFDAMVALCLFIQVTAIVASAEARSHAPLGASFETLCNIVSYRVIDGTFISVDHITPMAQKTALNMFMFAVLTITIMIASIRSGWRFRISALFPVLVIAFSLASPMMSLDKPQWPIFLNAGTGERYFFISNFSFFCMLLYLVHKAGKVAQPVIAMLFIVLAPLFFSYFSIPPLSQVGYQDDLAKFGSLHKGDSMDLHINPPGWAMHLIKR
jgi:hypothetical protein